MSDETNTCKCGTGLLVPFNLLALAVTIILATFMSDSLRQQKSLQMQTQMADNQGQRVVAAKQHYYGLYADLVALAAKDKEADAIVRKYGIQLTQPPKPATAQP